MHVLVIEDERRVARFLEESLRAEGYTVSAFETLPDAQEWLSACDRPPEIAVLDRLLYGSDSLEFIPLLKKAMPDCKILVLSAINSAEEKAATLDRGADDYLAKPFSFVELSARLRVLVRRSAPGPTAPASLLQMKNVTMDLLAHQVSVGGKRLDLSHKEFQLLRTLMQRPGQVFNKFQLLDKVWDTQFDLESNVVEVTIRNVRRKLERAQATLLIESRRNIGYWIEN